MKTLRRVETPISPNRPAGAIVLRELPAFETARYVTHWFNAQTGGYGMGNYFQKHELQAARLDFDQRCREHHVEPPPWDAERINFTISVTAEAAGRVADFLEDRKHDMQLNYGREENEVVIAALRAIGERTKSL